MIEDLSRHVRLLALAVVITASAGTAAPAAETLLARGFWQTDLHYHDSGRMTCETHSGSNTLRFGYGTHEDGSATILLLFRGGNGPGRDGKFKYELQIDRYAPWTITATKEGRAVSIHVPPNNPDLRRLRRELAQGNTLWMRLPNGEPFARFSLQGSSATLAAHDDCASRIARWASRR